MDESTAAKPAKYEEILAFLAANDEHAKLRALADDIRDLRDRLLEEVEEGP